MSRPMEGIRILEVAEQTFVPAASAIDSFSGGGAFWAEREAAPDKASAGAKSAAKAARQMLLFVIQ